MTTEEFFEVLDACLNNDKVSLDFDPDSDEEIRFMYGPAKISCCPVTLIAIVQNDDFVAMDMAWEYAVDKLQLDSEDADDIIEGADNYSMRGGFETRDRLIKLIERRFNL